MKRFSLDIKRHFLSRCFLIIVSLFVICSCATTKDNVITSEQKETLEIAEKEKEIGSAAFAKLAGKYGVIRDEALTAYLNKFGKSIVPDKSLITILQY